MNYVKKFNKKLKKLKSDVKFYKTIRDNFDGYPEFGGYVLQEKHRNKVSQNNKMVERAKEKLKGFKYKNAEYLI